MAKFCGKCGAKLDENTGLCPNCDAERLYKSSDNVEQPTPNKNSGEDNRPLSKKNAKKQRKADKKAAKKEKRVQRSAKQKIGRFFLTLVLILLILIVVSVGTTALLVHFGIADIPSLGNVVNRIERLTESTSDEELTNRYLQDFTSSENYFWENEPSDVIFSVSVVGNKPSSVDLFADDELICRLFDDGKNGDQIAGDGIYANTVSVLSDLGFSEYYCKLDEHFSQTLFLYFFEKPTEESVSEIQNIQANITAIESTYCDDEGYVKESNLADVTEAVERYAEDLYADGDIMYFEESGCSVLFKFKNGLTYVYMPKRRDIDAVGESTTVSVRTFQPCISTYSSETTSYMSLPDKAAEKIRDSLSSYTFRSDDNYDNQEVTLNLIKSFSRDQVIIWHGHGGYSESTHSYLLTGEEFNWNAWWWNPIYCLDSLQNRILACSNGNVAFTSKYVDKYCGEMDGTFLYLAACQSGKDGFLANSFLNKGAVAAVANSETIYTVYNLQMQNATLERMTEKNKKTGKLYTLSEALAAAKDKLGEDDHGYGDKAEVATPLIFGGREAEAFSFRTQEPIRTTSDERDIVLVLDVSGSMSGTPMQETKKASGNFVDTILDENAAVGIVTYDNSATVLSDFSVDKTALKDAVDQIRDGGGTNIESGLAQAYAMLDTSTAKKKIIVLMSDGEPNDGKEGEDLISYAGEIKNDGIIIYTLGFFESLGSHKSSAQTLMEKIASDGCHYEVADADDLVSFFEDMADQINGQKYIYIRIACPVDVTVTYDGESLCSAEDDLNVRTEFGTLTFEDNKEVSNADADDRIKVLRLKEGADYDVQIVGTGRGIMNYTIGFMDENGDYDDFRTFEDIKITRKTKIDTVAAVSKESILKIDEDGDGKYDMKLRAAKNGVGEEVKEFGLIYVAAIVGVILLLSLVILVVQKSRKKKKSKENM